MLDFTKQEKKALQFLLIVILVGLLISHLQKTRFYPKILNSFNTDTAKFELNKVTQDQLMDSFGLKQKIAQKIVDFRQERGGFSAIEELLEVNGVGEKTFFKLKSKLYLGDE